jgi:hypothetical protein
MVALRDGIVLLSLLCVYFIFEYIFRVSWSNHSKLPNDGRLSYLQSSSFPERWFVEKLQHPPSPYYHQQKKYFNITTFEPFSLNTGINIWDLFPPEVSCPDLLRVGRVGEGGKWICGLSWVKSNLGRASIGDCIVYSYGVSTDSTFEADLLHHSNGKCEVHLFDPTVGRIGLANMPTQFNKIALWNESGTNQNFLVTEHLFDTMHRLQHSFIDVLKVDIEGSEWPVFRDLIHRAKTDLLSKKSNRAHRYSPLPFGQLLIELHYDSVEVTVEFFDGLRQLGYLPYSREINLQPCLNGDRPVAVEYSFIHSSFFDVTERSRPIPSPVSITRHTHPNALIYYLTQHKRVHRMVTALQSLFMNFLNQFPHYPVLIFHDDLTWSDQVLLRQAVPLVKITFIKIELSVPPHLLPPNHAPLPDIIPYCSPNSSTIGYRHMCMFHATGVHQYLFNPRNGYSDVDYILRLDDDSTFNSPIAYDIFHLMRNTNKKYAFVNTVRDDRNCVRGLWYLASKFLSRSFSTEEGSLKNTYNLSSESVNFFLNSWESDKVFYNNFELSHVSVWKSSFWKAFMGEVDRSGGVYTLRWGDAPLHTINVLLTLLRSEVHSFTDIGYRHSPFSDSVAAGLPRPGADPYLGTSMCTFYRTWTCGNNSSNHSTLSSRHIDAIGPLSPPWGINKDSIRQISAGFKHMVSNYLNKQSKQDVSPYDSMGSGKSIPLIQSSSHGVVDRHKDKDRERDGAEEKDVLYTFAHVNRMNQLAGAGPPNP